MTLDLLLLLLGAAVWMAYRLVVRFREEQRRIDQLLATFESEVGEPNSRRAAVAVDAEYATKWRSRSDVRNVTVTHR